MNPSSSNEKSARLQDVRSGNSEPPASRSGEALRKPVLFVVDSYFPAMGGAERQALVLARALREDGVAVEFVCPHLDKQLPLKDSVEGFPITRIPYWRIKFFGAFLLMGNFALYMYRHRSHYSYVHVHITKLLAATLGMIKSALTMPVITKISGHAEFTGGVLDRNRHLNPAYRLMQHFIRKLDHVHTISLYTRDVLLDCGFRDEQILLIPNAVEVSRFGVPEDTQGVEQGRVRIGFVGRVEKVKGLDVLMTAVANLPEEQRQMIEVAIAGDGTHLESVKSQAESLGLGEIVHFYGALDDVPAFLRTIDIYVQPSYAEGLSNAVLEAMCASLPVIASRISGNTDLVQPDKNGLLFTSGDALGLQQCISQLLLDKESRRAMGAEGRQIIEQGYSTQAVSRQLMDVYQHV